MLDRYGLLPPHIRENAEREAAVDQHLQTAVVFATALHQLDPRLELWKAKDRLPDPPSGVKPGYWHVVRRNDPPVPDTYMAITTDGVGVMTGGFREPDSGVLESLMRSDMQGRHYSLPSDDIEAENERIERESREKLEDRSEEIKSNYQAAKRVAGDAGLEKRLWAKGAKKL